MSDQKPSVLYIEDDPASRTLVERTLTDAGFKVLLAETGLQGIDFARQHKPDIILTDINLPDLSGRELTTRLRTEREFQKMPIVAVTAQGYDKQRLMTIAAGATGYITKPIDVDALPKQVHHYLSGAKDEVDPRELSRARGEYAREIVQRLETRIRELETSNQNLRRLDGMKDTFIQLTAHELRTPMTLVYGYSRLLEDMPQVRELIAKENDVGILLQGLLDSTERMQGIINEILTISRIMINQIDLSIGPTHLGKVMLKALETYKNALQARQLTLHFDQTAWPERMQADSALLQLTFANLISNAMKNTPDGGHIYLAAKVDGERVRVAVRDSGIGINTDDQTRIFERFHAIHDVQLHSTSKTAFGGGGLGLGLAICKGIVEAHGGKIWVESSGQDKQKLPGSTFHLALPLIVQPTRIPRSKRDSSSGEKKPKTNPLPVTSSVQPPVAEASGDDAAVTPTPIEPIKVQPGIEPPPPPGGQSFAE